MTKKIISIIKICAYVLILTVILFSDTVAVSYAGEIHDAIDSRNVEKIKELIKNNPSLLGKADEVSRRLPLIMAIDRYDLDLVKLLVELGADVNVKNVEGIEAVLLAEIGCDRNIAQYLIKKGANVSVSYKGSPLVILAAAIGDTASVELLLKKGADVNARDNDGNSVLMRAVPFGGFEMVKYLVQKGANVNLRNKDGENALIYALDSQKFDCAGLFIEKSIEIEVKRNSTGQSALEIAIEKGAPNDIVETLIDRGADVDWEPVDNQSTLLAFAVRSRLEPRLIKKMIEKGARLNRTDITGDTALIEAAEFIDDTGCVKLLIEKGADVNAQGYFDRTAYFAAASKNNQKAMKLLKEAGARTAPESSYAKEAMLIYSVMNEDTIEIKVLLNAGASPDVKLSARGYLPRESVLSYTISGKKYEAMKMLLEKGAAIYGDTFASDGAFSRAVSSRDETAVKIFLEYSKNLDVKSDKFKEVFFDAIFRGSAETVRAFIKAGADVKCRDQNGNTPLAQSLRLNNETSILKTLIETGSDIDEKDNDGDTALIKAVKNGNMEALKLFLEKGAKVDVLNKEGMNALMIAKLKDEKERERDFGFKGRFENGKSREMVRLLIEKGAKVELKDKEGGRKMLLQAIRDGSTAEVENVIRTGISINDAVEIDMTPLMEAACGDDFDMVEYLVKSGAEINLVSGRGESALSHSLSVRYPYAQHMPGGGYIKNVNRRIAKFLISRGAKINKAAARNISWLANDIKNYELMELAIKAGADVNVPDERGKTALMRAAWHEKNLKMADLLLKSGSDVNAADNDGVTALMNAAGSYRNGKITSLLIKKGAKTGLKDKAGRTALFYAVEHGGPELTDLLLKNGADANEPDNEGNNALIYLMQTHEYGFETGELELVLKKTKNADHENKKNETALSLAAGKGLSAAVKKLWKRGAKADMNNPAIVNAFFINAVLSGNTGEAALLIKKGASVNLKAGKSISSPLLFKVVEKGDLGMVKLLVENGADLKYTAGNWQNDAFKDAVYREQLEILKYFASRGIDLKHCPDRMGVMYTAARSNSGKNDIMEFLLKTGGDINYCDNDGNNMLQIALEHQAPLESIKFLVESGADVNRRNAKGESSLHKALSYWKSGATEFLLENGADPYIRNNAGQTPLMSAVLNGNYKDIKCYFKHGVTIGMKDEKVLDSMLRTMSLAGDTVEVAALLDKGARTDAAVRNDGSILLETIAFGTVEVVEMFLNRGAKLEFDKKFYDNGLFGAASRGNYEMVKFFVENGADINYSNSSGGSLLNAACGGRNAGLVKFLLDKGAKGKERKDLLLLAMRTGPDIGVARTLLDFGIGVNELDEDRQNALILSMSPLSREGERGFNQIDPELVKLFIARGIDVNAVDGADRTALGIAMRYSHFDSYKYKEIVEILKKAGAKEL